MQIPKIAITLLPAMASLSLSEFWWFKIVVLLCMFGQGRVPVAACGLVPAMFDPETKQVIYNPELTRTEKKNLVVTIAQDVKAEKSSKTSKSESFGLNLGFQNSGIPTFGMHYQKVKNSRAATGKPPSSQYRN